MIVTHSPRRIIPGTSDPTVERVAIAGMWMRCWRMWSFSLGSSLPLTDGGDNDGQFLLPMTIDEAPGQIDDDFLGLQEQLRPEDRDNHQSGHNTHSECMAWNNNCHCNHTDRSIQIGAMQLLQIPQWHSGDVVDCSNAVQGRDAGDGDGTSKTAEDCLQHCYFG